MIQTINFTSLFPSFASYGSRGILWHKVVLFGEAACSKCLTAFRYTIPIYFHVPNVVRLQLHPRPRSLKATLRACNYTLF
jgi:hypothetical protein